jgi:Fic family protein
MALYNPNFLENTQIFSDDELATLETLSSTIQLSTFLGNQSHVDKFGLDFIHTSAKIEGNTYDKIDTYALIAYGRTAGGKRYSDAKMILNMRDAYSAMVKEDLVPDKKTLKDMHFILSNEMVVESERGTPRDEAVSIMGCDYVPLAKKEKLDSELNHLFTVANSIISPFNKAIYLHCNLAYLQYFKDCNKRTARMMLNISLKNDNKMLYIPKEERITEYLRAIVDYYESGNYQKFKDYFVETYRETILTIEEIELLNEEDEAPKLKL